MESSERLGHDWELIGHSSGSNLPIYRCGICDGIVTMDRGKFPSPDRHIPIIFMNDPIRFFTCGEYMAWNIHKE